MLTGWKIPVFMDMNVLNMISNYFSGQQDLHAKDMEWAAKNNDCKVEYWQLQNFAKDHNL